MISNVNIVSNVYVRSDLSLSNGRFDLAADPDFVSKIFDHKAIRRIAEMYPGDFSGVSLSELQNRILKNSAPCKNALPGERTHGIVQTDNGYEWACRCENYDCPEVKECAPPAAKRTECEFLPEELPWFDTKTVEELFEEAEDTKEMSSDEPPVFIGSYEIISAEQAADKIIHSDLNSRIMVNAGPGTGKTYTAIQRLLHILSSDKMRADGIIMLCYTRAAVGEIKKRIEDGIKNGELPPSAHNVLIGTLDSFATKYLCQLKKINLSEKGYNERIALFNSQFDPDCLKNYDYCIIDELQDIVNERALMVLNILTAVNGGFLLLGDKCQAIYDYDNKGGTIIKSMQFYERLKEILPADTKYYELEGNKRQTDALAQKASRLREALLSGSDGKIDDIFKEELEDLDGSLLEDKRFIPQSPTERVAILCRQNFQAEIISGLLHKRKIRHTLIRNDNSRPSAARLIADILWDYCEAHVTRKDFIERALIRCNMSAEEAEELFSDLSALSGGDADTFDMQELAEALVFASELPDSISSESPGGLYVSTIHKSKGKEFDRVFLMKPYNFMQKTGSTEEERVYYVAATRAKTRLELLNNRIMLVGRAASGHCVKLAKFSGEFKAITVGLCGDVDNFSFAAGDLKKAVKTQEYISKNVRLHDTVSLQLNSQSRYDVIHNGVKIGETSAQFSSALLDTYRKGNDTYISSKLPKLITDVYVNNIFTFIADGKSADNPTLFRNGRFWLALELAGLGNIK